MRSTVLRAALAAAGVCSLSAMTVQAQTTSTAQPAASELRLEEITITGSRVITDGNDAPTPITVITPEQVMATKPASLYENLVDMPVFSGSRGASNGPVTSSPNAAGGNQPNGAVSSLNLRNMGPLRTLVLFDGHRVPPISPDGLVDPSTLPQMLIQRVDVVTGGVSAVYGSDAITGVVNFVTDSKFNGVKAQMQYGTSQEGDANSWQAGVAAGTDLFGGRGHVLGSFQRTDNDPLYEYERDWTAPRWTVQGNGTSTPYQLVPYVTNATASFGGSIACANGSVNPANCVGTPNAGLTFKQNGVLSPYDPGTRGPLTINTIQVGGDGAYFVNVALRSKQTTDQFFTRFDYDLTDNVHAYLAGAWNSTKSEGNNGTQRTFGTGVNIGACNAFLSAAYQAQLGCTPANQAAGTEPTFRFQKQFNSLDNHGMGQNNKLKSDNYYVLAALDGKFGDGYRWDASYTHSQTELKVAALNQNRQQIYAALDAVTVTSANVGTSGLPIGSTACRLSLTNPGLLPGCIPMNLFGPTAMTRDMAYYFVDTITNTTKNKLDGVAASLAGSPLNGWAGPIDMALSAEMRRLEMSLDTNSKPTDFMNCTGLRFGNCTTTQQVHPNTFAPIAGVHQTIMEGAYEINLPLLKDKSVFKEVNFNGAARYAQYDNDPNNSAVVARKFDATTWKAGLTWDVTDAVTVRWTRSKDFRAPSLYDLYLPFARGNTGNFFDFLLQQASQPVQISGGNPLLDPEVAHTSTLGIVYRPTPNFSLSLDAYKIRLKDALFQLVGTDEPVQRNCYASGGASPTCQLQDRALNSYTNTSPSNVMTARYQRIVNIAQQETSGIDLESSFRTNLFDKPLTLRTLVTYQPHILYYIPFGSRHDVAGVAYPQIGGLPAPVVKASLFVNYKINDQWTVDLSERYRSSLHFSSDPAASNEIGGVASVAYTNVTVSYNVPTPLKQVNVFLNVQNLFDKDPPVAGTVNNLFPGNFGSGYAVGDDVVGRYYTLGVRIRL